MEVIVFILEGRKAEPKIVESLEKCFFKNGKIILKLIFGTSIYTLYKKLKEDEYLDILEILRKMSRENEETLSGIKRRNVSSVFLFFDQDTHCTNSCEEKLEYLLEFFNNENENGKLYISYPMVEALKDIENFNWDTRKNKEYKSYISKSLIKYDLINLSFSQNYNIEIWNLINIYNWCKANLLLNQNINCPLYNELIGFKQKIIFDKQSQNSPEVISLSAFPFFIANYFKEEIIEKILENKKII